MVVQRQGEAASASLTAPGQGSSRNATFLMEEGHGDQCAACAVHAPLPVSGMGTTWDGVSLEFC